MIVLKCALPYSIVYVAAYMLVMIQVPIEKVMGIASEVKLLLLSLTTAKHPIALVVYNFLILCSNSDSQNT